jgi:hypothetical protein
MFFFESTLRDNPARPRGTRDKNDVQNPVFEKKRQCAGLRLAVTEGRNSVQCEVRIGVFDLIRDLRSEKSRGLEGRRELALRKMDHRHPNRRLAALDRLENELKTVPARVTCCF